MNFWELCQQNARSSVGSMAYMLPDLAFLCEIVDFDRSPCAVVLGELAVLVDVIEGTACKVTHFISTAPLAIGSTPNRLRIP